MHLSEPRYEVIQVRVGRTEKRMLKKAARRRGLTLSEMVRDSATEAARRVEA